MYHEMTVFGFSLDSLTGRPLVILRDSRGETTLPIWISNEDVVAIAAQLVNWESTAGGKDKNLLALYLEKTGTEIEVIAIEDQADGIFAAAVTFRSGAEEIVVAVRPSEAIVAAIRHGLPVLVDEKVVQRASLATITSEEIAGENNARRFAEFLEGLDPASLGKYPM